jgi:hypothetical protein
VTYLEPGIGQGESSDPPGARNWARQRGGSNVEAGEPPDGVGEGGKINLTHRIGRGASCDPPRARDGRGGEEEVGEAPDGVGQEARFT